jgi:hypothetical protein
MAVAAVAAATVAGCARTTTRDPAAASLEPLAGLDAAFAGARGHRRVLALVSPN